MTVLALLAAISAGAAMGSAVRAAIDQDGQGAAIYMVLMLACFVAVGMAS